MDERIKNVWPGFSLGISHCTIGVLVQSGAVECSHAVAFASHARHGGAQPRLGIREIQHFDQFRIKHAARDATLGVERQ